MSGTHDDNPKFPYFLKRLKSQEMGSRTERGGRAHRGPYVLIPKEAQKMFPPRSSEILNDHVYIGFSPLFFPRAGGGFLKIYCDYIWHNSRFAKPEVARPRNEHRIYIPKHFGGGQMFQDDILVIRRKRPEELKTLDPVGGIGAGLGEIWEYFVDWIRPDEQPDEWRFYDALLTENPSHRRPDFCLLEDRIDVFERKINPDVEEKPLIDEDLFGKELEKEDVRPALFNQQSFRDFVLWAYDFDCAVSHEPVVVGGRNNLVAACIRPLSEGGVLTPKNGVSLRMDLAWAFRQGMITIDPVSRRVRVHEAASGTYLSKYDGVTVEVRKPAFAPDDEALRWHGDNVWGRFACG